MHSTSSKTPSIHGQTLTFCFLFFLSVKLSLSWGKKEIPSFDEQGGEIISAHLTFTGEQNQKSSHLWLWIGEVFGDI